MKNLRCLSLAIGLAFVFGSCSPEGEPDSRRTVVSLRASGELEVPPDEATLTIYLSGQRSNAKAAKAYLIALSNTLRDTLASFGVSPEHIQTLNVSLQRSYTWRNNSQVFTGYSGSTSMIVRVTDLGRLDEIYDDLLDRRELDTYGPQYGHSNLDSLRNVAYLQALDQAEVLGEALQSRLSAKHRTVRAIGNVELPDANPYPYDYGAEAAMRPVAASVERAAPRFEVSAGLIKVRSDIFVDYEVW